MLVETNSKGKGDIPSNINTPMKSRDMFLPLLIQNQKM